MTEKNTKRGQGSIRKLPSGRYQLRYTDPDGERRTARTTFERKAMAERELQLIRHSIETGTWHVDNSPQSGELDPKTITLGELAAHWRGQQVNSQGKPLAPRTLLEYERLINTTLAPFRDKTIRSITTQQLETWRARELEREVFNQTSKAYKHLKTLMTWAHKRRWISSNPCTIERATSYKPAEPPAPTFDQVSIMLANAPAPFDLVLAIAAEGGLRKGEIFELRRKDIEFIGVEETGETWVRLNITRAVSWVRGEALTKAPKTAQSVRKVLLPNQVSQRLKAHLKAINLSPEALLFSKSGDPFKHWGEYQLQPLWEKVSALAGFKGRFHSLRTYHLTRLAVAGATTKELMDRGGHSNIQTAMRYQRSTGREAELLQRLG